jgi:hypothetical protein
MSSSRGNGRIAIISVISLLAGFSLAAWAQDTVQVNIKSSLNARSVTTFSNGKLHTWIKGIDGYGTGDGYATHSAAVFLNRTDVLTLPDSARFPANANHPTMMLNYSNSDSTGFQTHFLTGGVVDSVSFPVPQGNYSKLYLALTSSEGGGTLDIVLIYSDGPATITFNIPDYAQGLMTNLFYVDSNMAKWNNQNVPVELTGHNLDGLVVTANPAKVLTSVKVIKRSAGDYILLWGVTGVGSNITTSISQQAPKASSGAIHVLNGRDGRIQFTNVKTGAELSVYSLSGERVARVASARQGTLTLGNHNADATVCSGVYICELRQGQEIQRMQAIVGK